MNMLKGDLPISRYCWAVVSQGFSSYAVLLKYWKVIFLLLLSLVVALSRYVDGQTPGVLRAGWYFLWWKQTALEFIVISVSWESGNAFRKPSLVWGDSCAMYLQSFSPEACFLLNKWGQQAVPRLLLWVGEFWNHGLATFVSAWMMRCVLLPMISLEISISSRRDCGWWGLSAFLTCQCLKLPHGIPAPLSRCPKLCKAFHLNSYSSSPSF